jgi:hypothetical protein
MEVQQVGKVTEIKNLYVFQVSPYLSGKEEFSIDFLLTKLQCHQDDEYPGSFSTSNSAPSSDLLYACKFKKNF